MKKYMRLVTLVAMLSIVAVPVFAQTMTFLKDSVVTEFKKDDFALMHTALGALHAKNTVGATENWSNSKSGNHGTVTIEELSTHKGLSCQAIKFENASKDKHGTSVHTLCKMESGEWKTLK